MLRSYWINAHGSKTMGLLVRIEIKHETRNTFDGRRERVTRFIIEREAEATT